MKAFFTHRDAVVPLHHPRVLFETAVLQGAGREALLDGTGMQLDMLGDPDARISYFQFGVLTRNALKLTGNPALGLDVGHAISLSHMGVLGLALMSSPTLGEALAVFLRHYRALVPALELEVRIDGDVATLTVREAIPLPHLSFTTEMFFAALETQGRALSGGPLPVRRMRFAYPEPDYSERYRQLADAPMLFDQDVTESSFHAALLNTPIAGADPATAQLAERYYEQAAPTTLSSDGLLGQLRRKLEGTHGPAPRLEDLAASLQTSGRSLRRYLNEMGTSYQAVLDDVLESRARELMRNGDMTVEQIGAELGFSSVRAFRRAFKRWTGRAPREFRTKA